jgi:hypothetical protein
MSARGRYSSCCGLAFATDGYPRVCPACARPFWDNPLPVVVVLQPVLDDAGRRGVVLIQRAIPPHVGGWALPGGFVELEDWRASAARELAEEGVAELEPEAIRPFAAHPFASTPDGRNLILFGESRPLPLDALPPFALNEETSARRVVWAPEPLCFPLHTAAVAAFFA